MRSSKSETKTSSTTFPLIQGEIIKIRDLAVFLGQLVGMAPKFEVHLVNAESYVASSHDGREWRQIRNDEKIL